MKLYLGGAVGFEPTKPEGDGRTSIPLQLTISATLQYMVGMVGLEPTKPKAADLQSAAIAAMRHPHIFNRIEFDAVIFLVPTAGLEPTPHLCH